MFCIHNVVISNANDDTTNQFIMNIQSIDNMANVLPELKSLTSLSKTNIFLEKAFKTMLQDKKNTKKTICQAKSRSEGTPG